MITGGALYPCQVLFDKGAAGNLPCELYTAFDWKTQCGFLPVPQAGFVCIGVVYAVAAYVAVWQRVKHS